MFDYMIRILDNNLVLVRNPKSGESQIMKPNQVSAFLENALEAKIKAQEELEAQVAEIKEKADDKRKGTKDSK